MEINIVKYKNSVDPTGRHLLSDITYDIDGRELYVKVESEVKGVRRTSSDSYANVEVINPEDFTEEEIIEAITPFWGKAEHIGKNKYRLTYYPTD